MVHRAGKYKQDKEVFEADIIDEIFSEIKKDIEKDSSYSENRKDTFRAAIHDIMINEKAYRNPALTRDFLIKRMDTGKDLFIKTFQCCFRMSFRVFINRLRLKEAIILLEQSDLSMEEIARKVGFGTVRTFQRQFRTIYNMSPKDYRKAMAK